MFKRNKNKQINAENSNEERNFNDRLMKLGDIIKKLNEKSFSDPLQRISELEDRLLDRQSDFFFIFYLV